MTRQIRALGIGLMVCFVVLFVQLNRLTVFQAAELNDNPNNTREILRDFSQPRGSITTADGVVHRPVGAVGRPVRVPARVPGGAAVRPRHRATSASPSAARAWRRPTTTSWPAARSTCRSRSSATCSSTRTASGNLTLTRARRPAAHRQPSSSASGRARWWRSTRAPARSSPWCRSRRYDPNLLANHDTQAAADVQRAPRRRARRSHGSPARTRSASSPAPPSRSSPATAGILHGGVTADEPVYPVTDSYTPPGTTRPIRNFGGSVLRRRALPDPPRVVQHRVRRRWAWTPAPTR